MLDNIFYQSWLGAGISLTGETPVSKDLLLRPCSIESHIDNLRHRAASQFEYGLLCSIAPSITFELRSSGATAQEAAIKSWNDQYSLTFMSILLRTFVPHLIQVSGGCSADLERPLLVSFTCGLMTLRDKPKSPSTAELQTWVRLLPRFSHLLQTERFRFAVSVASTLYVQPNPTLQVASIFSAIEALLDIDQELRFRIAMIVSKLLASDPTERLNLFKRMKRLYDGRSKCVHGGGLARDRVIECRDASLEILRQLVLYFVERDSLLGRQELEALLVA
ncbi:HEPN domain-containing protein [Bradyrhizobium cosmicum]|uniref:HEPN domain-containing protein n=1 Tax=Bradyrhizobium cosmicum TaxID=1404864 RepID=UPI0005A13DB9|nr:HEPN domain-containing protein [Bradyrhizobium cosmicum]